MKKSEPKEKKPEKKEEVVANAPITEESFDIARPDLEYKGD